MPSTRERRFRVAGFQVGVSADVARAERLRRNRLFRYMVRPVLGMLDGRRNGHDSIVGPEPAASTSTEMTYMPPAMPPRPADAAGAAIWDRVSGLRWYHTIDLGHGVVTPGFIDNRPTVHRFGLPADMTGMRCLDIGTYDGFWSFEMERRGAAEVIAIDIDSPADADIPRRHRQQAIEEARAQEAILRDRWDEKASVVGLQWPGEGFRVAKELLGSRATRVPLNVYDLSPERLGTFDVVIISQLLLRLRDPQTVLENMFAVTRGFSIVAEGYDAELEQFARPVSEFIGTTMLGAWWGHSIKSMKKMMEVAGFNPVEEVSRFTAENRAGRFTKVVLKGHAPTAQAG